MKQYYWSLSGFCTHVLKSINNCKISNPRAYGLRNNTIPIKIIKLNKIEFDFKDNDKQRCSYPTSK